MDDLISRMTRSARRKTRIRNDAPVPYSGPSSRSFSSFFQKDTSEIDGDRAYDAYGSLGTLFAIVSQIGNAVASAEWHLYKRTSLRDKKRRSEVLNHGFMTIWDRPNEFYTGRYFRECVQQHLDLVGEGVIVLYMIGNIIVEMWPVRPDRIHPVKHPTKFITGYIYKGPDGEEVPLRKEQVIHIKYPNPGDPFRGMGPVQTVLNDIDAAKFSAQWNKNFFINGAQPGGVITVDYRMGDDEFDAFLARWNSQHRGVANAHQVAVLENAKWQDTKFSMQDMQFVELRNLPRELVREAFAFPKPMLGTVEDVNRANADAGKEIMAEGQTIPRLSRWKDAVNAFLLPRFANGPTLELDYDDPTPINHEAADRERNSQAMAARNLRMAGWHQDDITDAVGLPKMRWVGIPAAMPAEEEDLDKQAEKEGSNG